MTDLASAKAAAARAADHRWIILVTVSIAQLMVVLDATIVNIALPSAQADLGFADGQRQWVVTAYALAFGSLLLLGGRVGDMYGRKHTFVGGLTVFALASAIGGAAPSFGVLVAARALQGAAAAMLAPAALSTLVTTFRDPRDRGRAFGVFGSVAVGGGAVGLILGGVLTQYLSWRWAMYVNVAFAAVAIAGALIYMVNERPDVRPKIDVIGAVLASIGLFALVFGFSHAEIGRLVGLAHHHELDRSAWCCWARSSTPKAASQRHCCRCGSSPTALAASPTSRSQSPVSRCSASSCS